MKFSPFLRSSRTCPTFKSCKWSLGGQVNLWSVFGHWGTCLRSNSWKFEPNWPIVHWVMTIFVRGAPIFPLLLVQFPIVSDIETQHFPKAFSGGLGLNFLKNYIKYAKWHFPVENFIFYAKIFSIYLTSWHFSTLFGFGPWNPKIIIFPLSMSRFLKFSPKTYIQQSHQPI